MGRQFYLEQRDNVRVWVPDRHQPAWLSLPLALQAATIL